MRENKEKKMKNLKKVKVATEKHSTFKDELKNSVHSVIETLEERFSCFGYSENCISMEEASNQVDYERSFEKLLNTYFRSEDAEIPFKELHRYWCQFNNSFLATILFR